MDKLSISKKLKPELLVIIIFFLLTASTVDHTEAQSTIKNRFLATDQIRWKNLVFKARSFLYDIDIQIDIDFLSPDTSKTPYPPTVKKSLQNGLNDNIRTNKILRISVITSVNPLIGSKEDIKHTAFYSIKNNTYIQKAHSDICKGLLSIKGLKFLEYVKLSIGKKKRERIYWLKNTGIVRVKKTPSNPNEKEMPPDLWTDIKKSFYPYGIQGIKPRDIIEPSILMLFPHTIFHKLKQAKLLVLNKRRIYLLQIHATDINNMHIFHLQNRKESNIPERGMAKYIKVSFSPRSLTNTEKEDKEFSFFGLKGDFDIYIDRDSGLPVLIHGRLSGFGDINIKLYKPAWPDPKHPGHPRI